MLTEIKNLKFAIYIASKIISNGKILAEKALKAVFFNIVAGTPEKYIRKTQRGGIQKLLIFFEKGTLRLRGLTSALNTVGKD